MSRRLRQYLRTFRLSAGLSQSELGGLIGVTATVIGNIERERCAPSLLVAISASLLFDKAIGDLFPILYENVEDALHRNALRLDERLRSRTDAGSLKKLALLHDLAKRARPISAV